MGLLHPQSHCRVWGLRFWDHNGPRNETWAQGRHEFPGALNITRLHEKGLEKPHCLEKQRGSFFWVERKSPGRNEKSGAIPYVVVKSILLLSQDVRTWVGKLTEKLSTVGLSSTTLGIVSCVYTVTPLGYFSNPDLTDSCRKNSEDECVNKSYGLFRKGVTLSWK